MEKFLFFCNCPCCNHELQHVKQRRSTPTPSPLLDARTLANRLADEISARRKELDRLDRFIAAHEHDIPVEHFRLLLSQHFAMAQLVRILEERLAFVRRPITVY